MVFLKAPFHPPPMFLYAPYFTSLISMQEGITNPVTCVEKLWVFCVTMPLSIVSQSFRVSYVSRGSPMFHIYSMSPTFPLAEIGSPIHSQSHPYFCIPIPTSILHLGYFDFQGIFSIIFFMNLSFLLIHEYWEYWLSPPAIFHLLHTCLILKLFSCFLPCSPLPLGKTPNKLPQIIFPPIILLQLPL